RTQAEAVVTRIIVDWGTSSFRAYRFGDDGAVAETHRAPAGILTVADGAFEAALRREVGQWLAGGARVLLSGMITSRNGWVETPYAETPASLADLGARAVQRELPSGINLFFLPGVSQRAPSPDVMRGEEIQVFGCFGSEESGIAVLPGTHSKWVRVDAGRITGFRTFMTGEVFAVMRQHSILGRLMPQDAAPATDAPFLEGLRQALDPASPGLLGDLFSVRSGVLLGAFRAPDAAERLSGLVIGHEIRGAAALGWTDGTLKLIGEPALCRRYASALAAAGVTCATAPEDAAVEGFRRLAALK
ncbi:MAG: 2-dehydro-3-deoxygalactonokinase, partial [Beijerinckiaceae bacterium]